MKIGQGFQDIVYRYSRRDLWYAPRFSALSLTSFSSRSILDTAAFEYISLDGHGMIFRKIHKYKRV